MFQGAGVSPVTAVAVSSVVPSLLTPSTSVFVMAPIASAVLDDTVVQQRPRAALFMQPGLTVTARRFAPRSSLRLSSSHPEGKGVGDYIAPTPGSSDRDRDSNPPRRPGNSGSDGSSDKPRDYTRDTGRSGGSSGGSSEKSGFAGVGDDEAGAIIWNLQSLADKRPDDDPAEKSGDNPDREGAPTPAPRDPSGELYPRRSEVDPGVSWGGGDDEFGNGSSNDGLF